jgi:hypothetical protein
MKSTFVLAVLLGFAGVLAAGHFVPWFPHVRLPSQTTVVANGGRAEQFLIRLPADRIAAAGASAAGIRAATANGGPSLPPGLLAQPLLVEHFKVRDSSNNVIGIAARHWSMDAGGVAGTAWSVLIPSRGALLLSAPGEARAALDAALQKAGYSAGTVWNGEVKVALAPDNENAGAVAAGSDEFAGLAGSYSEVWTLTGITDTGEMRGTIELNTVTRRGT